MAEESHEDEDRDRRMGMAILKGALIGIPVVTIALTIVILLITDNDLVTAIETAVMPGVLLGVFGGGFAGVAATME